MIGDTVAIEIPEAVSERDEARAIGACEAALGDDSCGKLDQGFASVWTAIVQQSGASELTIELKLTGDDEVAKVRVLTFTEEEPEAFRWQSVGVVVAALVLSQNPPEKASPQEPAAPEPTEVETRQPSPPEAASPSLEEAGDSKGSPSTAERRAADGLTIDLAPLVASSASGVGVAWGGWLSGALRLKGPLHAIVTGDTSWSGTNDAAANLRANSWGASLGLGLRGVLLHPDLGWELSGRGALQSLRARATRDAESGSAATIRWGARGGVALSWLPTGFLGVVAGGEAGVLWPPLEIEVGTPDPTRISSVIWGGYLGLRIRLKGL